MMNLSRPIVCLLLAICAAPAAQAEIRGVSKYQHAVFQRDLPIPISGSIRHGAREVVVTLNGQSVTVNQNAGRFRAELPAMEAGGPYTLTIANGDDEVAFEDVYVGEVWLCIGQSNMTFPMTKMHKPSTFAPAEGDSFPLVRVAGRNGWRRATDIEVIKNMPGTPYYFGKALHQELEVAIGLKVAGRGGTTLWQWTPVELHTTDELKDLHAVMVERNNHAHAMKAAKQKGLTYEPAEGFSPYRYPYFPFTFGEIAGFENWVPNSPARGVVFWQGENDIGLAANYEPLFAAMIGLWRSKAERDWPLFVMQLPTYAQGPGQPTKHHGIAGLRDAQRRVCEADPHSYLVVNYDIYGRGIHPPTKSLYGQRLAQTVLGKVYGKPVPWQSPAYDRIEVEGRAMQVWFKDVGQGIKTRDGEATLTGFTLAGADGQFHPATATLAGKDRVQLVSDAVPEPVAVRYAWANNPIANLVGDGGLPVSPFRSDDWELYPLPAQASPDLP